MSQTKEQAIAEKKSQIQEIYNQYKEFNTDYIYQKDLEILLNQISQRCLPLHVPIILKNMQASSKAKINFEEFIQLLSQQDSQDINVAKQQDTNSQKEQDPKQQTHGEEQREQMKSQQSIKNQLIENSNKIEQILKNPDQPDTKAQNQNESHVDTTKNQHNENKQSPEINSSRHLSVQNSQKSLNSQAQKNSNSRNSPRATPTTQQRDIQEKKEELQKSNSKSVLKEQNSSKQEVKYEEIELQFMLNFIKEEGEPHGRQSRENLHSHRSNKTNQDKAAENEQNKVNLSNEGSIERKNEEHSLDSQKRRRSSLDNSIKNLDNNVNKEETNLDFMSRGSQNFFNPKKNNQQQPNSDENVQENIQEKFDGIRYSQEEGDDHNINNFFSNNHSSVVDNSQEISEDQIQEYKQLLQKNQFPNHQNNCLVLQEYQLFYKDYINETFAKYANINHPEELDQDTPHSNQQNEEAQETGKEIDITNLKVQVNSFSSVMMELFRDKIWILNHKFDREEFHSKTNGYRKLFQAIDNYFIKVKGMNPGTFKLTEALFDREEFFKILEYWSSCEPQLYFSQEAPKYQNIDEQDELNYKSSMSLMSQVAQLRNNNSNMSHEDIHSARREQKLIQELKRTIEKYKKMIAEAESDVERKALSTIVSDLENQLSQYNHQNPHEISLLNNNYDNYDTVKQKQDGEERDNLNKKSTSKRSLSLLGPPLTKEEKREKNLQVIYKFYCKQSYVSGKYATFDRVQYESNNMSMGKFFLFVRDFGIVNRNLKKDKLVEIFKKNSANSKDITFEEFKYILLKIADVYVHEQKSENIPTEQSKRNISSIVMKTQESQQDKKSPSPLIKKQSSVDKFLQLEGAELDEYIQNKPTKSDPRLIENRNEKHEKFYNFICIDDQNKLKEKVKSPNLPFHTHAKVEPNLVNYKFNPSKYQDKQSEEIKEKLKQRKESKEREKAKLTKKYKDERELPQVSLSKKFSKNAQKKISNELEPIYGPTECTWESLLGNNYNQLRFLNHSEFKPTDLFDENTTEDEEYLEHYKIDYKNAEQQKQKEDLLKKIQNYGEIKPRQSQLQKQQSTVEANPNDPNLQLIEQSQSYEVSPQQARTNKIFLKRDYSGVSRGKSQPSNQIVKQSLKIPYSSNKINNEKYIKIDHQNESGNKSQRNISQYDVNSSIQGGQRSRLKEQYSVHSELQPQYSSQSINVYDVQPQYSYFQTPEKKLKLRESRSLQKSQQTDNSFHRSRGNSLMKNNKDINNASVGDLIDFFNPITDRQKNIVKDQRQRISQIENASRMKEKEMIENLINSSNSQNLLSKKLSLQNQGRQNNFSSNKKNSYIQ